MESSQRTQLELYEQVLSAYQQADYGLLMEYAYTKSGDRWRSKKWFPLAVITLLFSFMLLMNVIGILFFEGIIKNVWGLLIATACTSIVGLLVERETTNRNMKIMSLFSEEVTKYSSLLKIHGEGMEFYRYIVFKNHLNKVKFQPDDVKYVTPLLTHEQHNLAAYVARKPLHSWIYASSGAVLAASASTWHPVWVVGVIGIGILVLIILHLIPVIITNQRRHYELDRFLAWYEADARKF